MRSAVFFRLKPEATSARENHPCLPPLGGSVTNLPAEPGSQSAVRIIRGFRL
jgi:hypothetical protein